MKPLILLALLAVLATLACGTFEVGVVNVPANPSAVSIPPTDETLQNTAIPQSSATLPPVAPTAPEPSATAPLPTETIADQTVLIYLIAIDDNGQSGDQVGCGDSLVPVEVQVGPRQDVLRAAIEALLSIKDQYYGESGLYNALYQSDLQVESLTLESGTAVINLTGTVALGGECDDPRFVGQLEKTAMQFSTVSQVEIMINGQPLSDYISLRG
jgi:hypothetical protein